MASPPRVVALIMAAGQARRFGSDKRLARLPDGETLLAATLAGTRYAFTERFLVIGRHDDTGRRLAAATGVDSLVATRADLGLGFSIADATSELLRRAPEAEALAVVLGDMPRVAAATYADLVDAAHPGRIVRPGYRRQPGHPVLFGRDFWPALSRLAHPAGARDVIVANRQALHPLEVDDPGILLDVDRPGDLARLD
ncbi:nucleotidyltransferase family protein [Halomonas salifodinae]|uniref:nucleotidyltransferase family protein n=1 Tax=Halomonas salifodinae TaxID=438745 RepID=UPI0033B2CCF1